jgi:type I restriction enzyme S subunit
MSYKAIKLGDICDFLYGEGLTESQRRGGEFPVYGSNGMVGWHDRPLTQGPTIVIGRKGSIGEVHLSTLPCWPIDTTYYVQPKGKPCDLVWLYYTLLVLDLTKLNKSAAVPGLNRNDAYEKEIPLLPLDEQKRIAAILSKADRLRRLRRYARELSDGYLGSIFLEMFGDPVTNPRGWKRAAIGDVVASSQYGTSNKSNSEQRGYPVLGMGNITYSGRIDLSTLAYVELSKGEFEALRLKPGDIIFNRTNSTELVGKTAHWDYDFDAVIASYLVKLKLKKDTLPEYFTALLNSDYYKGMFQERCKKAVGQSNISPTLLKEFPMLIPPLSLQQKFAHIVQKYERLLAQQQEAERQAEHLFQTLLDRAFRGEV